MRPSLTTLCDLEENDFIGPIFLVSMWEKEYYLIHGVIGSSTVLTAWLLLSLFYSHEDWQAGPGDGSDQFHLEFVILRNSNNEIDPWVSAGKVRLAQWDVKQQIPTSTDSESQQWEALPRDCFGECLSALGMKL